MSTQWTDEQILTALDSHENDGKSGVQIGRKMGKSEDATHQLFYRIRKATDASDPDHNKNGTMPRKWWVR